MVADNQGGTLSNQKKIESAQTVSDPKKMVWTRNVTAGDARKLGIINGGRKRDRCKKELSKRNAQRSWVSSNTFDCPIIVNGSQIPFDLFTVSIFITHSSHHAMLALHIFCRALRYPGLFLKVTRKLMKLKRLSKQKYLTTLQLKKNVILIEENLNWDLE